MVFKTRMVFKLGIFWIYFLLISLLNNGIGQNLYSINYTVKNGLPSNSVYDIALDSFGYVWITTNQGVAKFDGRKFKIITADNGILSNDNFSIAIDNKNNVYLRSYIGVSIIDSNFKVKNKLFPKPNFPSTYTFDVDANQNLYCENNYTLYVFGPESDTCFVLAEKGLMNYLDDGVFQLLSFRHESGVLSDHLYIKDSHIYRNSDPMKLFSEPKTVYNNFVKISDNEIAIVHDKSLKYYRNDSLISITKYPNDSKRINKNNLVQEDRSILLPLNNGIYKFSFEKSGKVSNELFFDVKFCSGIVKDSEGNYWLSTLHQGVYKIKSNHIRSLTNFGLNYNAVKLSGSGKNVWIADIQNEVRQLGSSVKMPANKISEIYFLKKDGNDIWYGGSGGFYKNDKLIFSSAFKSFDIHGDSLAITNHGGISFYSKSKFPADLNKNVYFPFQIPIRTNAIYFKGNTYYSGNDEGLFTGDISELNNYPLCVDNNVGQISVNGIIGNSKDEIWVSTKGNGLYLLKGNQMIRNFRAELSNLNIHSMKIDEKERIWLSSKSGIDKIYLDNGEYKVNSYSKHDGLPSNFVFDTYCYDDLLYAATDEGLVTLNVKEVDIEKVVNNPKVYILDAYIIQDGIKNLLITQDSINKFSSIQNSIAFDFTGICHHSEGNISFEYRLVPNIQDWRVTENDNVIFSTLNPGKYTFEVRAINSKGFKSKVPAQFSFEIDKHFTQNNWFRAGGLILISFCSAYLFFLFNNYKRSKIIDKNKNEKLITELRLKSLQAQLNPHFIFNSLNAIQQFINTQDRKAANKYLVRFAKLMRLYLNGSENQFVTLDQEMEVVQLYIQLEHLRFQNKFQYEIIIDENIEMEKYMVPAMLLQPYVENAIRHGLIPKNDEFSLLQINVKSVENGILCQIIDSGIGREKSMQINANKMQNHRSLGNKISNERLEAIMALKLANITQTTSDVLINGKVAGTKVEIFIGSL